MRRGRPSSRRALLARRVRPPWLGRTLVLVWWARLSMSVGRALAGVVTALYLADRGLGAFDLALLFMATALVAAALSTTAGLAADRIGRRPFLIVFPFLTAAAAAVFASVTWMPALLAVAALGSFGRGSGAGAGAVGPYQPAESALVTESVPGRFRNAAFGRLAFGSGVGAFVGGLLAILAGSGHGSAGVVLGYYRPAFVAIAVVSALAGVLAFWMEEPERPARRRASTPRSGRRGLRLPLHSRALLLRLWATNSVNGVAVGMFGPFVSYWLYRRFGATPAEVGSLFAVVNLATLPSPLSSARLARRFGLIRALVAIRVAQGLLLVPLALSPSLPVAGAVFLVRMLVQRAGMPLRQSYVLAMAHPQERATVAGLSNLPSQLAMGVSPLLTGYLFDSVSLDLPLELAGVLQLVNAALYWRFFRDAAPEEERREVHIALEPETETLGT